MELRDMSEFTKVILFGNIPLKRASVLLEETLVCIRKDFITKFQNTTYFWSRIPEII